MARKNSLGLSLEQVERHNAKVRSLNSQRSGSASAQAVAHRERRRPTEGEHEIGAMEPTSSGVVATRPLHHKRSKYGNEPVIVDGIRMASKKEAKRYRELGLLLKSGHINFLARQVRFALPGGIEYVADFLYGDIRNGKMIDLRVEDSKGVKTEGYKLKKKLMASIGVDIVET